MHLLDHQFGQVREHVLQILFFAQHPRVHIADDGRGSQVKADHLGHIGVDGFIVRHAGADGIGDGNASGAIGCEQPRNSQHGIGPKHQRVQEIIVDTPVDDIDPLRALGGAHEHRLVAHEQILPFHRRCPSAAPGRRVRSSVRCKLRGQQHQWIGDARGAMPQAIQEHIGVMIDRCDAMPEKSSERAASSSCDSRACGTPEAQVVFQHLEFARIVANDVNAGDVSVDAAGDIDALYPGQYW